MIAQTTDQKQQDFAAGKISIALTIPPDFTRKYIALRTPSYCLKWMALDPGSYASALGNVQTILNQSLEMFNKQGLGSPPHAATQTRSVNLIIHKLYNEANNSAYNIIPGLSSVLLTLTMVMLTSTAITSEKESGHHGEMLLSTSLRPTEIIVGKVVPYIFLGYLQLISCLFLANY